MMMVLNLQGFKLSVKGALSESRKGIEEDELQTREIVWNGKCLTK